MGGQTGAGVTPFSLPDCLAVRHDGWAGCSLRVRKLNLLLWVLLEQHTACWGVKVLLFVPLIISALFRE